MEEKGSNPFEDHPILSKLSVMDRISLSASLAAELNAHTMRTRVETVRETVDLLLGWAENAPILDEPERRALKAAAMTLTDMTVRAVETFRNPYQQEDAAPS